jgi:hypothetical protein
MNDATFGGILGKSGQRIMQVVTLFPSQISADKVVRSRLEVSAASQLPKSSLFMSCASRVGWISLLCVACGFSAFGQTSARLQTSDTELVLEAGPAAPRLTHLAVPGQSKWENRASEVLIASAEISDKPTPLHWNFNREASQIGEQRVAFVYDSASPRLRLTWEWRTRQAYGPIEHQIRIENLDTQEIWIPMQDSLAFNWQVDLQAPLEHLFVEKGANTPSLIGTHQVALAEGWLNCVLFSTVAEAA